jgi:hypothetical protein
MIFFNGFFISSDWDKYLSATDRMEDDDRFRIGYSRMPLEPNKYFSGIPVNTNFSVVHVPTNVFDGGEKSRIFYSF